MTLHDHRPIFFFRQWREAIGLSQQQMAVLMGVTKTTVSRIESGKRAFTSDYLIDFWQAVGCNSIADPLINPPPTFGRHHKATRDEFETMLTNMRLKKRAREIRRLARAQNAEPAPRKSRRKKLAG